MNTTRSGPHEALGQEPPALHFGRSGRAYVATPPPWAYPPGSDVHRVDANAMITYRSRRFFVGEALIGEWVACTRLAERVLVTFRHMFVRELELRTGRTRTLLRPVDACLTAPTGMINVLPMS